jgi:hypothetical protein
MIEGEASDARGTFFMAAPTGRRVVVKLEIDGRPVWEVPLAPHYRVVVTRAAESTTLHRLELVAEPEEADR